MLRGEPPSCTEGLVPLLSGKLVVALVLCWHYFHGLLCPMCPGRLLALGGRWHPADSGLRLCFGCCVRWEWGTMPAELLKHQ